MKIKYLSPEDRQTLHFLRHTTDPEVIAVVLESTFKRSLHTMQALWEYRKWFWALPEEKLYERPVLMWGLSQIVLLQGDPDKARELIRTLPEDCPQRALGELFIPGLGQEEMRDWINKIKESDWELPELALTAGRPSIINGIWDTTPYAGQLAEQREELLDLIRVLYKDNQEIIYDIAVAEVLYQQNDCHNALINVVSKIPFLQKSTEMRILFAALALEIYILALNGQASAAAEPLIKNLRQQISHAGMEAYLPNIDAMDARAAMYDGDYVRMTRWLRNGAPDEHKNFCMLDLFRYFVKMRAYIIQNKHMAVTALANRLQVPLEKGKRYMDSCELQIIWAMSDHADGRTKDAFDHLEKALVLAERFRYDRLIADEGFRIYELLKLYKKEKGGSPYLNQVLELSRAMGILHPHYLRTQLPEKPAITQAEMRVLRLLAALYTNAQIAEATGTAVDTVKQHCKHIFAKLGVKNRHQAVQRAIEIGILDPTTMARPPIHI